VVDVLEQVKVVCAERVVVLIMITNRYTKCFMLCMVYFVKLYASMQ